MIKRNKKNFFKKAAVGIGVVGVLFSTNIMAATASGMVSTPFTKAKVDSNEYTTVATVKKQRESSYAYVTIDDIYKADGSSSKYKKIKGKVHYKKGDKWCACESEKDIPKNREVNFYIPREGRTVDTKLRFRGMGNNPSLDCKVSGHFDTY